MNTHTHTHINIDTDIDIDIDRCIYIEREVCGRHTRHLGAGAHELFGALQIESQHVRRRGHELVRGHLCVCVCVCVYAT
jgi:hypothetical protein